MIHKITERLITNLPQWMNIRKDPESIGAQFLNVFGLEFADIERYLEEQLNNQFIGTANLGQIDILYRGNPDVKLKTGDAIQISGDTQNVSIASNLRIFYESTSTHLAVIDYERNYIYTKHNYDSFIVTVNDQPHTFDLFLHHVWNTFDEMGLLLDTPRLYGEDNVSYKRRILDVFYYPGSATHKGLQHYLGRQFGIAPDHVKLDRMQPAFVGTMLDVNGNASPRLRNIIKSIGEAAPVTWQYAQWDQTYWQLVSIDMLGLEYLPHIWDITIEPWQNEDFQSGIGNKRDLKIESPVAENDEQTFDYFVGIHGATREEAYVYVPYSFMYQIHAEGIIPANVVPPESYHAHIVASEVIPLIFTVRAYQTYVQDVIAEYIDNEDYNIDDSLEIIPGNLITCDNYDAMRVRVTLGTHLSHETPVLSTINLHWLDDAATPELNTTSINTESDWNDSDTSSFITVSSDGNISLSTGEFNVTVDTSNEWNNNIDTSTNINTSNNMIKLKWGE